MNNNPRKIIFGSLGILFFGFVVFFGYSRFGRYLQGPKIVTSNIETFHQTDTGSVPFLATLENTRIMSIGHRDISINEKQEISELLIVPIGHSSIEMILEDHFGKKQKYIYTIYNSDTAQEYSPTLLEAREKIQEDQIIDQEKAQTQTEQEIDR